MNQPPPTVPPKKSGGCVKGCLIAVAVVLLISGIAAYFVVKNIGSMARQFSSAAIDKLSDDLLKDAKLDPDQKAKVDAVVKGFTGKIRNGEVGLEQGIKVMESLVQGPFVPYVLSASFNAVYIANSTLPPAEVQEGRVTLGRFMQGVVQQSIPKEQSEVIFDMFSSKTGTSQNGRTFKPHLTDDEIRQVLAKMKIAADSAAVPQVPIEIDVADELQKAFDKGLQG